MSRYTPYFIPALVGVYFALLNLPDGSIRKAKVFVFTIIFVGLYFLSFTIPKISLYTQAKTQWKDCYLQTENIDHCTEITGLDISPVIPGTMSMKEKLDYMKEHKLNLYQEK